MAKSALPSNAIYLALGAGALYVIYKSGVLQNVSQGVGAIGTGLGTGVQDVGSGLGSGVQSLGTGLGSGVSQVGGGVLSLGGGLGSGLQGVGQGLGSGVSSLGTGLQDIGAGFMNLQTNLSDGFNSLLSGIGSLGANINTPFGSIKIGANAVNAGVTNNANAINSSTTDKQVNSSTAKITAKTAVYGTIANEFGGYSPTINGVQQLQSVQAPTNAPKSASVKQAVIVTPVSQTQTYALGQQYLSAVLNNRGPTSLR